MYTIYETSTDDGFAFAVFPTNTDGPPIFVHKLESHCEAFVCGEACGRFGINRSDCPWPPGNSLGSAWRKGHAVATGDNNVAH